MNKQQAQNIIKETFENSFDKIRFTGFIKNLLNQIDDSHFAYYGKFIPDAYKPFIGRYERIGKYSDSENRIDILIVYLNKETSIEHARTRQRNFIAGYLEGNYGSDISKDAALVAFVSPNEEDWRFSLVKMDYKFEQTESGKMKVKEEFSPARRWSFLVGSNESSHTAQSRLVPILTDDQHNPTLAQLEEAFNIEKVTKEFFEKYRDLFLRTKETLDEIVGKDPKIKADFEAKSVDTVNFAKKLLGQIVFLYFLQKKGWFGVERDAEWGTGSKKFLRELFEKEHGDYQNFFNDILEHLFYDALRDDRSFNDYYYSRFNCKIPFLNGGLFDPIGSDRGYDWVHTDILLPNELFSNQIKTKEGDIGNGILDIFDRYNFTVKEDEPLEKEVAIDPELLGKAYEKFNAIRPDNYDEFRKALKSGKKGEENKFNKKFGVYYTPREIVHYMCQQSLINYLATEMDGKVSKESIEFLILEGERYIEYLKTAKQKMENKSDYKGGYKENQYFNEVKKYVIEIEQLLLDITVCDPAVGSGAFPVGMMSEIVKARNFFVETGCLDATYINKHNEK
ncbi:MAG: BREX-1 system adenine-specific DNA-methyltransferase PglX, partial [Candidatus Marinimicrobia bacterium]|nr:BREX-1 system adenine-specific DNA-methyltransferase PglX [Candidatus Neomarinimicrobiota bacterium]